MSRRLFTFGIASSAEMNLETQDEVIEEKLSDAEFVERFLPNLLVG